MSTSTFENLGMSVGYSVYPLLVFIGAYTEGQFFSMTGSFVCMTLELFMEFQNVASEYSFYIIGK